MILGVLQARVSSSRLPGKVLLPVLGEPMISRQIERVRRAVMLDELVVATSTDAADDALVELCERLEVACFRGSLDDVLDRFRSAARSYDADHVVRLTGDCPLADPAVIDAVVQLHVTGEYDYTSNTMPPTFPDGLDVEVITSHALERTWTKAQLRSEREHVTLYAYTHPEEFRIGNLANPVDLSLLRWTVDEQLDLDFVRSVFETVYPVDPTFGTEAVLRAISVNPVLATMNAGIQRNEGLDKSRREDASTVQ